MWKTQMEFVALGLVWSTTGYCSHLGNDPVDRKSLPVSLRYLFARWLSLPLSFSVSFSDKKSVFP